MRIELLMAAMMMAPLFAAYAGVAAPTVDWHRCERDTDCVLVPGICGEAAVNSAYVADATAYYQDQKKSASCGDVFWHPKASGARCHLESCEIAIESAK